MFAYQAEEERKRLRSEKKRRRTIESSSSSSSDDDDDIQITKSARKHSRLLDSCSDNSDIESSKEKGVELEENKAKQTDKTYDDNGIISGVKSDKSEDIQNTLGIIEFDHKTSDLETTMHTIDTNSTIIQIRNNNEPPIATTEAQTNDQHLNSQIVDMSSTEYTQPPNALSDEILTDNTNHNMAHKSPPNSFKEDNDVISCDSDSNEVSNETSSDNESEDDYSGYSKGSRAKRRGFKNEIIKQGKFEAFNKARKRASLKVSNT